ncbi:MAG TPA: pyridoxamine 5'-phosphate oxidase [Opitutaceae bacterium]|nr:pyridoxamine 5'-phosphate oxidase [Opitutaceae bacterium]
MTDDPIGLFQQWYAEAQQHPGIVDASAMALATADRAGRPAVRMVLLKGVDGRGFLFFTNLTSPKARQLEANPEAELCFHWAPLARQVRVHGRVEPAGEAEADAYFGTRPRLSQLGAWASVQSTPMPHRFALEAAVAAAALRFGVGPVPRPPHWSGYRVIPSTMEFWIERPFRQHERRIFIRTNRGWDEQTLFP